MIDWLMLAQAIGLAVIGFAVVIVGLARKPFNDWILGAAALALLTLIVQAVASIVAPIMGAGPTGDVFEYWVYLISALLIPPAAVVWALIDKKSEWQSLIVGIAILAVAVMAYRMHQIWFVQVA